MDFDAVLSPERDHPEKSVEYRQRATECRALAYEVCNEGSRKELLDLAEVWASLAETRVTPPPREQYRRRSAVPHRRSRSMST